MLLLFPLLFDCNYYYLCTYYLFYRIDNILIMSIFQIQFRYLLLGNNNAIQVSFKN